MPSSKIDNTEAFKWLLERTLMYPRDIVLLFNKCINRSINNNQITVRSIREAWHEFSTDREESLYKEWENIIPTLPRLVKSIFFKKPYKLHIKDIKEHQVLELIEDIVEDYEKKYVNKTTCFLYTTCQNWQIIDGQSLEETRAEFIWILYLVGCIDVKLGKEDAYQSAIYGHNTLRKEQFMDEDVKISLRKVFHKALQSQNVNQ